MHVTNHEQSSTGIGVLTPIEKLEQYFEVYETPNNCVTCNDCFQNVCECLRYEPTEIDQIEKNTRGQHENPNWTSVRQGLVTASKFKEVCSSRNPSKTAEKLLHGSSLDEERLPKPIAFGRKYEHIARNIYYHKHKFGHKACSLHECGLFISNRFPFVGASPDGIIDCKTCGKLLIEIKCLFKYRNFHPKNALLFSEICEMKENTLVLKQTHPYYFQIQAQMGVTGISKCMLVAFTQKAPRIVAVEVPFDVKFWEECVKTVSNFYQNHYITVLKSVLE